MPRQMADDRRLVIRRQIQESWPGQNPTTEQSRCTVRMGAAIDDEGKSEPPDRERKVGGLGGVQENRLGCLSSDADLRMNVVSVASFGSSKLRG